MTILTCLFEYALLIAGYVSAVAMLGVLVDWIKRKLI